MSEQEETTGGTPSVQIESFEESAIPSIVEFWNDAFSDRRNFLPMTPELFRRRILNVETNIESFHPDHFLMAQSENRVLGIIHVGVHPESFCEVLYEDWGGGEQGYIGLIAVHPDARKQGIGSRLWEAGMDRIGHTENVIIDGQCLNPYYGNSLGPFQPFWGTSEGISIRPDQKDTIGFFARRGFEPRYKGLTLITELPDSYEKPGELEDASINIIENEYPAPGEEADQRLPQPAASNFIVTQLVSGGKTAGLLAAYPFENLPTEKWGIYEFHVDEALRGQDLGKTLLERTLVELDARGADSCETLALEDVSDEAIQLYKSMGFEQDATWLIY